MLVGNDFSLTEAILELLKFFGLSWLYFLDICSLNMLKNAFCWLTCCVCVCEGTEEDHPYTVSVVFHIIPQPQVWMGGGGE